MKYRSQLGILAHAFPPSRARSLAFATFSAGAPVGAVFGTAVGGILTEFTKFVILASAANCLLDACAFSRQTWRSSCYLLAGITTLCFIGGLFAINADEPSEEKDKRVDWFGAFLVTAGLVQITFVLSQGALAPKKWATPCMISVHSFSGC